MNFDKEFSIKRHCGYYKTFSEFLAVAKYYLKRYKNNTEVDIFINKKNFSIVFKAKGNLCFY